MLRSLALFLCCASAAATSASTEYAAAYAGKSEDMLSGKYSLYWRTTATHLEIAINALTPGWVAFGLAEQTSGTMGGSDIVTVHFDTSGTPIATDTFAEDKSGLKTDTQQDWVVVKGTKTAGSIAVELRRLLDTKDGSDRALATTTLDNPGRGTRVVIAYGASATVGYHSANRAGVLLPIMKTGAAVDALSAYRGDAEYFSVDMIPTKAKSIKLIAQPTVKVAVGPIAIPEVATGNKGYFDLCFTAEDLLNNHLTAADIQAVNATSLPFHIVGHETLMDKTTTPEKPGKYVHHYVVYGHYDDDTCGIQSRSMIVAWAPGVLPAPFGTTEAGFPVAPLSWVLKTAGERSGDANANPASMGVSNGGKAFRSFTINTHYDNPTNDKGVTDDSGMRLWFKKKARKFDLGVMQLGDGRVRDSGRKLPTGFSEVQFECPSSCTAKLPEPVTMLASQLHMHSHGIRIMTEQFRNGTLLGGAESPRYIDYYDFNFQDGIDRKMTLKPGDAFRTTCQYKTNNADVSFGAGSEQEMCIDFVTFFPAEPLVSMTNGYCGNEGSCGGQKLKPLTAVTLPQLNAVRSFPCTGVDATCGAKSGSSWAGNEDMIMPVNKCEKCIAAQLCFTQGCAARGADGVWRGRASFCNDQSACESCYPASPCLSAAGKKAIADQAAEKAAAAEKVAKAANDAKIDGLYNTPTLKMNAASALHRDARFAALAGTIVAVAAVAAGAL